MNKIDGSGEGNFVKLKIDIWEAILRTLTAQYLPAPFFKKYKKVQLKKVRAFLKEHHYEEIGIIVTVSKYNDEIVWLLIARRIPNENSS